MIILVTGLGRCGSSLVMQMLNAAGIETTGEKPFYEAQQAKLSAFNADWVADQNGKAVKVLGLNHCKLNKADYKIIYCLRDHKIQAKSQKKFYEQIHHRTPKTQILTARIRKESKLCLAAAKRAGPVLSLRFEDFQDNPIRCIADMCKFLNLDPEKVSIPMYNCIIRRDKGCMPDMRVEEMLKND